MKGKIFRLIWPVLMLAMLPTALTASEAPAAPGIEMAPGPSADSGPVVPPDRGTEVANPSDIPYRGSPGPAAPRTATEVANLSDIPHWGSPSPDAPGDIIENFPNTWADSTVGLLYDIWDDDVMYAHERTPDSIHGVDYPVPHPWLFSRSLSEGNPGWPVSLDNRDGAGHDIGSDTFFWPDFNGDLDIADDNIVETTYGGAILNAWEIDGAGNDSYDGSFIDLIVDIAVVPGEPTRYFVAASGDGSVVYEIDLIKAGWWAPGSWGTLGTCTVPGLGDNVGIDYDLEHGVLYHSDGDSTTIVITDLACNVLGTFTCDSPAGFNTGVTFIEGKAPPEIWVTDFSSESTTRCEAPKVIDDYEPDNTSSQANWIYDGSPQTHSIVPVGDVDWVKFSLSAESEVVIQTSGPNGDTRMWLYDSSLSELEYNDDWGGSMFSRIDRLCDTDALPAGTYYAKIDEYYNDDAIPSYNISFTVVQTCERIVYLPLVLRNLSPWDAYFEENDHWLEAYGPLAFGQAYQAYPDDAEDYYYFELASTATVSVGVTNFAPTSTYGDLLLYGPAAGNELGDQIAQFGQPGHSSMVLNPGSLEPGKYYIRIYVADPHYSTTDLYTLRITH